MADVPLLVVENYRQGFHCVPQSSKELFIHGITVGFFLANKAVAIFFALV